MKKAIKMILVVALMLSMTACGGSKEMSKDEMLEIAEEITIPDLTQSYIDNKARAMETHGGKVYITTGFISEIQEDYCRIITDYSLTYGITVYLPKDDILTLNTNEKITVVGEIDKEMDAWSSEVGGSTFNQEYWIMKNAFIVTNTYEATGVVNMDYKALYNQNGRIQDKRIGDASGWHFTLTDANGVEYSLAEAIPVEHIKNVTINTVPFSGEHIYNGDTITVSGKLRSGNIFTDITLVSADPASAERWEASEKEQLAQEQKEVDFQGIKEQIDKELQGSWVYAKGSEYEFITTYTNGNFSTSDGGEGIYTIEEDAIKLSFSSPTYRVVECPYAFENGKLTLIEERDNGFVIEKQ